MSSSRELVKGSCLQVKTIRWAGTLRKKKKPLYEPASWVVLCVHENRIPCLEWYEKEALVEQHQPDKVLDLLYTTYVNLVPAEPRLFVIGFTEREPLELASESPGDTLNWVALLFKTLKKLSTQSITTNFFQSGNVGSDYDYIQLPKTRQMAMSAASEARTTHRSSLSESSVSFQLPETSKPKRHSGIRLPDPSERPPLPYRPPYSPLSLPFNTNASRRGSVQELPNGCLSPGDEPSVTPHILSPLYDNPRSESVSSVAAQRQSMNSENGQSNGDSPRISKVKDMSPTNCSSSPLESTISSTTSLCSSLSSELRLSSTVPTSENSEYDYPRDQAYLGPVKCVSLNLSIIVEHVLFVEMKGRVWVAGWSEPQDKQLSAMLNFGDELIEVEGNAIKPTDIPQIFYNVSGLGTPILLVFRPTPLGKTYTLMKPIRKDKDIGIRLHKRKNRVSRVCQLQSVQISEIIVDSSADRRGLVAHMPSAFHGEHQSSAVITEVAGRRLNPFARNDQFLQRYDEIHEGIQFSLTIHPHDFMKELKQQLMSKDTKRNYKAFLSPV